MFQSILFRITWMNLKSFCRAWKIILCVALFFLICIYNKQEMNSMMYSYDKTYSYFDFVFFMLGSKYDPIHYRLLETMVMILPYILFSYLTAIYSLEEGILKSYMTIPRVKSLFKWYFGHIITLIITCFAYVVIEHICIFIVSLDLPKHVLNSDNALLPVITNQITTLATVISIQIISMLFFQILQLVISLLTSNPIYGFLFAIFSYVMVFFTNTLNIGALKWIPGIQLIVKNNSVSSDFVNTISPSWSFMYMFILECLVIGIGWFFYNHKEKLLYKIM